MISKSLLKYNTIPDVCIPDYMYRKDLIIKSSSFYAKKIFPLSKIAHNKQSKEYAETNPV